MLWIFLLIVLLLVGSNLCCVSSYSYQYGKGSPKSFYESLEKWGNGDGSPGNSGCRNPERNTVYCCASNEDHIKRDWTMDGGLVNSLVSGRRKPVPAGAGDLHAAPAVPQCKDLESALKSVEETVLTNDPNFQRSCSIAWLTPKDVCKIMGHYSSVFWSGDSMTRHMLQVSLDI